MPSLTVAELIVKLQQLPQDLPVVAGTDFAVPIVDVSVVRMDQDNFLDEDKNGPGILVVAYSEGEW
jgi:hypothetical protein